MENEPQHTVQRECRPKGGHVRLLHIPSSPKPFVVLADFPWAAEDDTRAVVTDNFAYAHKEYAALKEMILKRA